MKLPPRHPVPPVAAAPHAALHQQPARTTPAAVPGSPAVALSSAARLFSAPRQSRSSASLKAVLAGGQPHRRRHARGAAGNTGDAPWTPDDVPAEREGQRTASAAPGSSLGGDGGQDQQRDGREQERRFAQVSRARRVASDPALQALLAQLLADARTAQSIDDVVRALRPAVALPSAGLAQALVGVARQWQATRPSPPPVERTTLAQVRRALVQAATAGAGHADTMRDERREIVHLWLPIYLLNLSRPRLPGQQEQAVQRMALIERALGKPSDP